MRLGWVMVLTLLSAPSVDSSTKKDEPKVYDHVGIIRLKKPSTSEYEPGRDTEVHLDTPDSSTTCYVGTADVSCGPSFPHAMLELDDKESPHLIILLPFAARLEDEGGANPLAHLILHSEKDKFTVGETFNYRYAKVGFTPSTMEPAICVPYDVRDKKGRIKKQSEACYEVLSLKFGSSATHP